MSSNGSSMSQWKRSPPLTGCYQTIRARPPQRTLEETSAASLHSDTSASHTLPPQRAREPCGQRQRVKKIYKKKNGNCPCCEFQSVTSAACASWCSSELRLTLQVDKLRSCNEKWKACRWERWRCEATPRVFSRAGSLFRGFLGEWRTHTEL